MLTGMSIGAHASVFTRAEAGDTLWCEMTYKGDSLYDNFVYKGRGFSFSRKAAPYYTIVMSKDDSLAVLSLCRTDDHLHIADITYQIYDRDSLFRHGIWQWYDDAGITVYQEHYDHNKYIAVEQFVYDLADSYVLGNYYTHGRYNGKTTTRFDHMNIYSPSGHRIAIAHYPRERVKNNSRGAMALQPSTAKYFDESGNVIQYTNTQQVEKAVQRYIQRNFKSPKVENSFVAQAAFDVIVKTEKDGKITILYGDSESIHYLYTKMEGEAQGEFQTKMIPHLKDYLANKLPAQQLQAKPVLLDKQPTESLLYFTVIIILNTSW